MTTETRYCAHCAEYVTPFPNGACSGCYEKSGMYDSEEDVQATPDEGLAADWEPSAPQDTRGQGDENYRPIGTSAGKASDSFASLFEYRDLGGLTLIVKVLLVMGAFSGAALAISSVLHLNLLRAGETVNFEGMPYTAKHLLVISSQGLIYMLTLPFFGRWILLANRNVRALGAQHLGHSPGLAVGGFFIPLVNLVIPYRAMKELEHASHDPAGWPTSRKGTNASLWWALWILIVALTWMPGFFMEDVASEEGQLTTAQLAVAVAALHTLLCLMVFKLIAGITKAQHSHVE